MIFALLLLASSIVNAQCNDAVFNSMQFPKLFFTCYHNASSPGNTGACMFNSTESCSSVCVQQAAVCVEANCALLCSNDNVVPSTECSTCSNAYCAPALQTCVGQPATDFSCGFFCMEEYWVFPVVLAAASLAGVLLCIAVTCCVKSCCCAAGEEEQREELTKYNPPPKTGAAVDDTINLYKRRNVLSTKRKDVESLQDYEHDFEATNPVFSYEQQAATTAPGQQRASLVVKQAAASLRASLTKKRTADSNVRVSQLPQGFRQSIQVGLTPDMIFDMDTAQSMKQANNRSRASVNAASAPARVIQSHKFATMMGVDQADLNKPYSEPVTQRVERMAKVANAQGINVGGSTAGLGPQIAHQFTLNQRARQEREEERIREEIRQQSLQEKKQAQQHNSMKLASHQSINRQGNEPEAVPPVNRLKQFLQENS